MELENTTPSMPEPDPPAIFGAPVMTMQQCAELLGVTDSAIFYTEKRALKKLRRILIRRLGAEFFGVAA